jgi:hypothetical protein
LPIWLRAKGRILITGLGLGCVVRGLVASPQVEHVDVVEIDADILSVIGSEFATNPRVTLHHGDAHRIAFSEGTHWDFAWHDIWTEQNKGLHHAHMKLLMKFNKQVAHQGAWQMPRAFKRLSSMCTGAKDVVTGYATEE